MRRLFENPEEMRFVIVCAGLIILGLTIGAVTYAAFLSRTTNSGNSFGASPDFAPPDITTAIIAKSNGYVGGKIKQGGTYYVYAQVTDSGNPPSGVATVRSNVALAGNVISTAKTSVTMCTTGGPWTVEGQSYNYRSTNSTCAAGTTLTADAPLSAGSKNFRITATDNLAHSGNQDFSVTIDNTAPTGSNVTSADGGGTAGKAELGDTVTFTYSKPIDPASILAGWDGSSTNVVVRMDNAVVCAGTNNRDCLRVYNSSNTTQLALGEVNLVRNYVAANRTFGAAGTPSTMVMSGSTVTVTLGTASGATRTVANNTAFIWAPSTAAFDQAGNALTGGNVTQSPAQKEF